MANSDIFVVGMSGSLREGSFTNRAVEIVLAGAREVGAQTRMLNLNDYDLKFLDVEMNEPPPNVLRLREDVKAAHGIILGTPEYHGSFSGVLKHALDLMGFEEFEGKLVGLVGVAGGRVGAINSLNSLRTVGRSLHAWVVPEHVSIPEVWQQFDDEGNLINSELEERLKLVGRQVALFAYLHNSENAIEFLQSWESAPHNPGGANR